ncbi:MAG: PadR family transcriptional regulator [Pseudolysinimonas sp.]
MALRYALLALLTAQPMTGYDIAKAFHSSVGHVWHAPDSQIYPELRRMEQAGLIEGTAIPWGTKGTKTSYAITPSGEAAFRVWMSEPLAYARDREPAHLRAAYFEWTDAAHARAQLEAHRAHFSELREQWQEQLRSILDHSHPVVARRLAIFPEREWKRIVAFKAFAYEGLVARANQEIAWAERGLRLVDEVF